MTGGSYFTQTDVIRNRFITVHVASWEHVLYDCTIIIIIGNSNKLTWDVQFTFVVLIARISTAAIVTPLRGLNTHPFH